jgi:predicted membrane channel-forming protein YqfA (hemolysin III family)
MSQIDHESSKELSEEYIEDNNSKDDIESNNVPEYLKDKHITEYVIGRNHSECIRNLFKLHHESVNAWTMIFSNLFVLLIVIYIFMRYRFNTLYSIVFIIHLLAYTIHTPFSVGYHTFNSINKDEFVKWRKYDIYGVFLRCIILSFTMSFFTYSDFTYVLLNTSLTIAVVYYSLLKFKKSEDEHKSLDKIEQGKIVGYVALCSLIPLFYKVYKSIKNKKYDLSFKIVIIIILFYFIGIISYCFRIPDKYFEPGTFNKIGSSHNIMHFGLIITSICEILYVYVCAKEGNFIKSFK